MLSVISFHELPMVYWTLIFIFVWLDHQHVICEVPKAPDTRHPTHHINHHYTSLHEYAEYVDLEGPDLEREELLVRDALLVVHRALVVITQDLIRLSAMSEVFKGI